MEEMFQMVLPSGRCVRFVAIQTRKMLSIQTEIQRRFGNRSAAPEMAAVAALEIVANSVRAVTNRRPRIYREPSQDVKPEPSKDEESLLDAICAPEQKPAKVRRELDCDAMLAAVTTEEWAAAEVTYRDLITKNGPKSIDTLLGIVDDFNALVEAARNPHGVEVESTMGKAQMVVG